MVKSLIIFHPHKKDLLLARPTVPFVFSPRLVREGTYDHRAIWIGLAAIWNARPPDHMDPDQFAADLNRICLIELCCREGRKQELYKCNTVLERYPNGEWKIAGCPVQNVLALGKALGGIDVR